MTNAIEVVGLKKSYGKLSVLQDVSLTVKKGSIFALLGSNGAGKTTMINILTTLINADSGSATVEGYDSNTQADKVRRIISLTGQFAAVDDILTARENLHMIAELRHVANPARTATDLLKQFDLGDAADRRVATFSGGMRRRLDIAMSLVGNPTVIFLDEPTTGLDPQSRTMMWQEIKAMAAKGITIFLTTQYLEEADQLADEIAILNDGKIVASGTAKELKAMLPHGKIELVFATKSELDQAVKAFSKYRISANDETLVLGIVIADGIDQIASIIEILKKNHLNVKEFTQKSPSLDDVFMKVIAKKEKN